MKQFFLILTVAIFLIAAGCTETRNENTVSNNILGNLPPDKMETSGTQPDVIWQVLPQFTPVAETYPPNVIAPTTAGGEVADLKIYAKNTENTVRPGESVSIDVVFESIGDSPGIIFAFPPKMLIAYREKPETGRYQVVDYIDERGSDVTISPGEKITQNVIWTPNETGEFCLAVMDVNIFSGEGWYGYYSNVDPDRGVSIANITVRNSQNE